MKKILIVACLTLVALSATVAERANVYSKDVAALNVSSNTHFDVAAMPVTTIEAPMQADQTYMYVAVANIVSVKATANKNVQSKTKTDFASLAYRPKIPERMRYCLNCIPPNPQNRCNRPTYTLRC